MVLRVGDGNCRVFYWYVNECDGFEVQRRDGDGYGLD